MEVCECEKEKDETEEKKEKKINLIHPESSRLASGSNGMICS